MKPLIGITCNFTDQDKYGIKMGIGSKGQSFNIIAKDYVDVVLKADAIPILIPCTNNIKVLNEFANICNGLILTGGNDINPLRYKERADENTGDIQDYRDDSEIYLFNEFYNMKKPIFGVCRGMQLINIALGGTLHVDLAKKNVKCHCINSNDRFKAVHEIVIEDDCILFEIFNKHKIYVNSYHHQAVNKVAKSLRTVAVSDDGVIEAIELKDKSEQFLMGVQWHPEMMAFANEEEQILIDYFIDRCRKS